MNWLPADKMIFHEQACIFFNVQVVRNFAFCQVLNSISWSFTVINFNQSYDGSFSKVFCEQYFRYMHFL